MYSKFYLFFLLITLFLSLTIFCKDHINSPVIARVGKSILTVEDLKKNIPPEYSSKITPEQNINYVKQWIETELLFQEALKKNIHNDKKIKKRLYKMKRELLAAELINRITSNQNLSVIDSNEIHTYYELHKDVFIRKHNKVKYMEISVVDSKIANHISKIANENNILSIAAEYTQNTVSELSNIPYVSEENIPPDLLSAVRSTSAGSVSAPIKYKTGYHVVFIFEKLDEGKICSEEEVKDDIYNLLLNKTQKKIVDTFVSELRLKTDVEFNSELIINTFQMD